MGTNNIKTWQERAKAVSPLNHPDELEFRAKFYSRKRKLPTFAQLSPPHPN